MSSSVTSFLFLFWSRWKGRICLSSLSNATISPSRTTFLVFSLKLFGRISLLTSGYFGVLSSAFLLKILIFPSW